MHIEVTYKLRPVQLDSTARTLPRKHRYYHRNGFHLDMWWPYGGWGALGVNDWCITDPLDVRDVVSGLVDLPFVFVCHSRLLVLLCFFLSCLLPVLSCLVDLRTTDKATLALEFKAYGSA